MLSNLLPAVLGLVVGYLFGSFPTGYFAGRLYGVDVRRHGSGRTGGSNVLRSAGVPAFLITIFGDVLKGMLPILLMRMLWPAYDSAPALALLGVLLGHNWSIFIALLAPQAEKTAPTNPYEFVKSFFARAKGGAGVATTAGAALTLFWPPIVPLLILGIGIVVIFKYSSLASITVAILYPLLMAFFVWRGDAPPVDLLVSLISGAIVVYVLIPNMKRLRAGTEQKFGQRLGQKPIR